MLFSEPSQDCPEDRVQPAVQTAANNTAAVKTAIFFFINLLIFPGTCLTQLAEKMGVAPKTISKWECAQGFPDVSLLPDLSDALGTDMTSLLSGQRNEKEKDGGNMKRIQFYTCPTCGNILIATGGAEIACCGRKLGAMKARARDETHALHVEEMDGEWYVTLNHPMTKAHFIRFIACVGMKRVLLVRLYPEQNAEVRMPKKPHATWYIGCSEDGLYTCRLK